MEKYLESNLFSREREETSYRETWSRINREVKDRCIREYKPTMYKPIISKDTFIDIHSKLVNKIEKIHNKFKSIVKAKQNNTDENI